MKPVSTQEDTLEKRHGRLEKREYEVFETGEMLKKWPDWSNVRQIIRVKRYREVIGSRTKGPSTEYSYYGANNRHSAQEYAQVIREHWWTENKNHHVKDTAFLEDNTTKRVGAYNFSVLISTALNILRANKIHNIKGALYENSMDFSFMLTRFNLFVG